MMIQTNPSGHYNLTNPLVQICPLPSAQSLTPRRGVTVVTLDSTYNDPERFNKTISHDSTQLYGGKENEKMITSGLK